MNNLLVIVIISILGPLIGSFLGIIKKPSERFTYNLLSFAAGVMISISFVSLIPESIKLSSIWICVLGLAIGATFMFLVDKLIPHIHPTLHNNPEEKKGLRKTFIYLFIGMFIHNFPEGIAMGINSVSNFKLSFAVAIAISIHDIPETICISAPYYRLTGKRWKAFLISASTIIPTLGGFFLSYFLAQYIPTYVIGLLIGATAGLMIYISGDELIPSSCCKVCGHNTMISFIIGVILVMLVSSF